jgi:hypothetical protein
MIISNSGNIYFSFTTFKLAITEQTNVDLKRILDILYDAFILYKLV